MIKELTKEDFDSQVLKNNKKVLVDFYADWCGPCKMQSPILEEFARQGVDIDIVKVNIYTERGLATKYGIYSIPTLMLVKNGEILKTEPGFKNILALNEFIKD